MNTVTVSNRASSPQVRSRHWLGLGVLMLALTGTVHAAEGSLRHEFLMRGQVIDAEAGALVVCVGDQDGAQIGQELDVISHRRVTGSPKEAGPRFRRETVGRVRITSLFDQHYATAEVVHGRASLHDTVELIR